MRASLIVTTYKTPDLLRLCLATVARQSAPLLEVIVAEDGEDPRNVTVLREAQTDFSGRFPLRHVTQKDVGNRKPLIMNKAVVQSQGDYLIFIDGDCLLRSDFASAHLTFSEPAAFLTGRRVELSEKAARNLDLNKIRAGYLDGWPWALYGDALWGQTQSLGRFFRTPAPLRGILGQNEVFDIRGCNFSVARAAIEKINGFDNEFSGAYGEDSDAEYRLKFAGLRMKSVKGAAIQFHLWHPTQTKDLANQARLAELMKSGQARARSGLNEAGAIK